MEGRYVHQKLEQDAQQQARGDYGTQSLSESEYDSNSSRREWLQSFQ